MYPRTARRQFFGIIILAALPKLEPKDGRVVGSSGLNGVLSDGNNKSPPLQ